MKNISKSERVFWGVAASLVAGAAISLVALGIFHRMKPLMAYSSGGGATAISLTFLLLCCRKVKASVPQETMRSPSLSGEESGSSTPSDSLSSRALQEQEDFPLEGRSSAPLFRRNDRRAAFLSGRRSAPVDILFRPIDPPPQRAAGSPIIVQVATPTPAEAQAPLPLPQNMTSFLPPRSETPRPLIPQDSEAAHLVGGGSSDPLPLSEGVAPRDGGSSLPVNVLLRPTDSPQSTTGVPVAAAVAPVRSKYSNEDDENNSVTHRQRATVSMVAFVEFLTRDNALNELSRLMDESDFGVNVSYGDQKTTPLMELAKTGKYPELVKKFSDKGADFNYRGQDGNTPLMWACANAHYSMAKAILATKKTDLSVVNDTGYVPVHGVVLSEN